MDEAPSTKVYHPSTFPNQTSNLVPPQSTPSSLPNEILFLIATHLVQPYTIKIRREFTSDPYTTFISPTETYTILGYPSAVASLRIVSRAFDAGLTSVLRNNFDGTLHMNDICKVQIQAMPSWLKGMIREIRLLGRPHIWRHRGPEAPEIDGMTALERIYVCFVRQTVGLPLYGGPAPLALDDEARMLGFAAVFRQRIQWEKWATMVSHAAEVMGKKSEIKTYLTFFVGSGMVDVDFDRVKDWEPSIVKTTTEVWSAAEWVPPPARSHYLNPDTALARISATL